MCARTAESREVEDLLGCVVLNRFTEFGICQSELVVSTEDSGILCAFDFICATTSEINTTVQKKGIV